MRSLRKGLQADKDRLREGAISLLLLNICKQVAFQSMKEASFKAGMRKAK